MGWTDAPLAGAFPKYTGTSVLTWFPSDSALPFNIPLFLTIFVLFFTLLSHLFPPAAKYPRFGINPGPFNLFLGPARIAFLLRGPKIMEEAYEKVTSELPVPSQKQQTAKLSSNSTRIRLSWLKGCLSTTWSSPQNSCQSCRYFPSTRSIPMRP